MLADSEQNTAEEEDLQALRFKLERCEQQLRQMALISEIAEAANNTSDPADAVGQALKEICEDTRWPAADAFIVNKDGDEILLKPMGVWHLADKNRFSDFVALSDSMQFSPGEGLPGIVYRDGEALWASAIKSDSQRLEVAKQFGLHSAFGFPVLIGGEVVAVLEFFSEKDSAPDEVVLDTVSKLGMLLGRVFERQRASRERELLNRRLVATSRQAGMAEVASGVLHNVGNALNSVTVSATVATDTVQHSYLDGLDKVLKLVDQNKNDLPGFFANSEKAGKLIAYLNQLAKQLHGERETVLNELHSLLEHIEHIKNIVRRQQHYAKPSAVKEHTSVKSLVEDSLKMIDLDREDQAIELIKEFADIPDIYTDKHNVIQILNNLVGNAKHALRDMDHKAVIKVRTALDEENKTVRIEVSDNGCGIPPELQRNIFQFGFTTKESGHGFGLHMSANAAKVMGAKLSFSSEGAGKGSIFTLEIPFITDATNRPDKEGIAA